MSITAPGLQFPAGIDGELFLRKYWQKRPLLMRAALPVDHFSLSAEELAGLACESEIESRLIIEHGKGNWELLHGPFGDADFADLPESHWTLLVQDVDKFLPQVARLIDDFGFVPGWRIDDVMISFATDQGGVGPHTDAYDVFLMQAEGRRRWRISEKQYTDEDLLPDLEQRILSNFEAEQEWILEPGDILYLPPGVAHWGTAEGDCMTYSLGFRAPSQQELASDWFQYLVAQSGDRRLGDPADLQSSDLAALTAGAQDGAAKLLAQLPTTGSEDFQLWLGRFLTDPKPQFHIVPPDDAWNTADLADWLEQGHGLSRHPFARLAWARVPTDRVVLFYQGENLLLPQPLGDAVRLIAEQRRIDNNGLIEIIKAVPAAAELLLQLINAGILEPAESP